jgi:hypothetical protein
MSITLPVRLKFKKLINNRVNDKDIYISWREITAGGSPVKVTGQLNFSSDIPNFWLVKLFSLKQSLVKYTPKNVTIFPV